MIITYGGDIIKFAGDAMLVVWRSRRLRSESSPPQPQQSQPQQQTELDEKDAAREEKGRARRVPKALRLFGDGGESLRALVVKAAACNLRLMRTLNNHHCTRDVVLTLHTGACGDAVARRSSSQLSLLVSLSSPSPSQALARAS